MSWDNDQFLVLDCYKKNNVAATYSDGDGTTLSALLDGDGVRLSEVGAPVSSPDGNDGELGDDDGGADGGSDFLGGLDTETDVALGVTDDNDSLEAGTLTGTGLLLDGLDLWEGKNKSVRVLENWSIRRVFCAVQCCAVQCNAVW